MGFSLSFKYPKDWVVKPVEQNGGGGEHPNFATIYSSDKKSCVKISVTSEPVSFTLDDVLKSGATNWDSLLPDNIVINRIPLSVNGLAGEIREVSRNGETLKTELFFS